MSVDVNCPYCNAGIEIEHDDGFGMKEDEIYRYECGKCGKNFVFTTCIIIDHTAYPADCLNGGEHNFKRIFTYPSYLSVAECRDCGERRNLPVFFFTFGSGQKHEGCFTRIAAETADEAREIMFEKYGRAWSMQYTAEEWEKNEHRETEEIWT